jgi:hypothetical protein
MGKGKPFLEVLASVLSEAYKIPILEVFIFLYALATFIFAGPTVVYAIADLSGMVSEEAVVFSIVKSLMGSPLFIFVVLILKNIAYGVGNDLERGIIQTYLSYPLKRISLLTANIVSSLGVALLLLLGIEMFALFILVPDLILANMGTVLLSYVAYLSYPLLVAGLVLLLTLYLKKGGTALVAGILLYFGSQVLTAGSRGLAVLMKSDIPLRICSIINPTIALEEYFAQLARYVPTRRYDIWTVNFSDALLFTGASYVLVLLVFVVAYLYFKRRLET